MSGEKKFQPTAKKILKAREDGDVAKSRDLTHAVVFTVNLLSLMIFTSKYAEIRDRATQIFETAAFLNLESTLTLLATSFDLVIFLAISCMLGGIVAGLVAEFLQAGCYFLASNLSFKTSRLNIFSGLKRMLGYEERGFTLQLPFKIVKIGLLVIIVACIFRTNILDIGQNLLGGKFLTASIVVKVTKDECMGLVCYSLLFMISFGVIEFLYERIKRRLRLMMDTEEIKQEFKEAEGDPQIKHARKCAQQEICEYSKINDVRNAKVVITDEVSK